MEIQNKKKFEKMQRKYDELMPNNNLDLKSAYEEY